MMICRIRRQSEQAEEAISGKIMPPANSEHRVHHRDFSGFRDDNNNQMISSRGHRLEREDPGGETSKISYSAIVNKSIMNKLAWSPNTKQTSSLIKHNQHQQHQQPEDKLNQFSQTMYRMTSMHSMGRRYQQHNPAAQQQQLLQNTYLRHSRSSSTSSSSSSSNSNHNNNNNTKSNNSYKLMTPSLIALILAYSCLIFASSFDVIRADDQQPPSALVGGSKQDDASKAINENSRSDSLPAPSSGAPSSVAEKNSIVASLSSAVASAAAAAAVAAAKNSLSSGDARSLLSSSGSGGQQQQSQRSPGLTFALKLADTIPEVPYSILHNMKKLDHAAPFYNVPGKQISASSSIAKESGAHSLLLSALTSRGGAVDQLNALFRSPLWKRIADGYGEFSSEFRSLFRARPTTMKGPSSSTTKLLRDISMPAALMLLASAIPSDWRPSMNMMMKNRRKSMSGPLDLTRLSPSAATATAVADQMDLQAAASTSSIQNYSPIPSQQLLANNYYARPTFNAQYEPSPMMEMSQQQQQQQLAQINGLTESVGGSVNLQNWMSPGKSAMYPSVAGTTAGTTAVGQQEQQQQQQPAMKRVGESVLYHQADGFKYQQQQQQQQRPVHKPVNIEQAKVAASSEQQQQQQQAEARDAAGGLFSSLTSRIQNPFKKSLMSKIMNANGIALIENHHHYDGSYSDSDSGNGNSLTGADESVISRRHQLLPLSDKHRYSLVGGDELSQSPRPSSSSSSSFISERLGKVARKILSPFSQPQPTNESGSAAKQALIGGASNSGVQTINLPPNVMLRRDSSATAAAAMNQEQRDLSQLLPQSWREVVKKTVNSVKQEASTQWRSIEGQLTNWVQDKLKTLPMTASQPAVSSSTSVASVTNGSQPVVSNLIASVSSTAMNILGLGGRSTSPTASSSTTTTSSSNKLDLAASGDSTSATTSTQKNSDSSSKGSSLKQGALAGVANMIVNTLTQRLPTTATATGTSQKSATVEEQQQVSHQYPTLTGAQQQTSPLSAGTTPTIR